MRQSTRFSGDRLEGLPGIDGEAPANVSIADDWDAGVLKAVTIGSRADTVLREMTQPLGMSESEIIRIGLSQAIIEFHRSGSLTAERF